ncbi:TetR/AcrR family transcriptional regulator C-terminal domain-containing protein [Amycolatopsis sp. La24]|uniref:TetR/AcrR family transcriptional regulator n=1 Tax=Amycolatopsis sp. La24 TaxID=3028304 RepID=UPI0023B092CA|nr:TetR/AcrR family transcriptional regulator C-terminal domain-containing protein [Amycolatopsis sp. La24]
MGDRGPTPPIWLLPGPPERGWGLGRVDIVNAAVRLADHGGAEALTMRAVAKELGASTPMSLYRYVHSKDGLVDLMLDLANGEVRTPEVPGEDWRGELTAVAVDTWAMTKRHPWYARLVHQRPPAGPNASRRTEFVLATFDRLGQDLASALGYARLLDGYVTGQALQWAEERAMWQRNAFVDVVDVQRQARAWFGDVPSEGGPYPLLVRVLESFLAERHDAAGETGAVGADGAGSDAEPDASSRAVGVGSPGARPGVDEAGAGRGAEVDREVAGAGRAVEPGRRGSGQQGAGQDDTGRQDTERRDTERQGSGRPGSGRPGSGRQGSGPSDSGRPGSGLPGSGQAAEAHAAADARKVAAAAAEDAQFELGLECLLDGIAARLR